MQLAHQRGPFDLRASGGPCSARPAPAGVAPAPSRSGRAGGDRVAMEQAGRRRPRFSLKVHEQRRPGGRRSSTTQTSSSSSSGQDGRSATPARYMNSRQARRKFRMVQNVWVALETRGRPSRRAVWRVIVPTRGDGDKFWSGDIPAPWPRPRTIRRFHAKGYSTRWAAAAAAVS